MFFLKFLLVSHNTVILSTGRRQDEFLFDDQILKTGWTSSLDLLHL